MKTKKQKLAYKKFNPKLKYSLLNALKIIKLITFTNFDSSVDMDICLRVDTRKPNQIIRGSVNFPCGTGKNIRILALVPQEKEKEAKQAGAEYVGLNEYINKIKENWLDFDTIVTTPSVMEKIGLLGKILGPKGLMPNPKIGTVTFKIGKIIKEIKLGKTTFKVDKYGIIHISIGKVSFSIENLEKNANELIYVINKLKPITIKGTYLKNIYLSSTMSPGVEIDIQKI